MPAPVRALIGAVVMASIGAAIWAGIMYYAGVEVKIIALLVGGLAGVGAAWAVRGDVSEVTGGIAAAVALVAVLSGKYVGTTMIADDAIAELQQMVREENANLTPEERVLVAKMWVADDVVEERLERSFERTEDEIETYTYLLEAGEYPEDYPRDIIEETELRWSRMSQADRDLTERRAVDAEFTEADRADLHAEMFEKSFEGTTRYRRMSIDSPIAGYILVGFAVVAAFFVGANENTYPFGC